MLAHFTEKGGKFEYWLEMMERLAMISLTILILGTWAWKGEARCQGTSLDFKI